MLSWFKAVPPAANTEATTIDEILAQMNEPRPLPMGRTEFGEWSYRIISGALLPMGENEDPLVFLESQKFALANMLMHLGPTESHKPDAYFIHSLRKFAVNQVADAVRKELHEGAKVRTAKKEEVAKKEEELLKAVEAKGDETLARIGATSAS